MNRAAINRIAGSRIRSLRQGQGMSQQELATRAGVRRTSITNIEAGRQAVVTNTFVAVADVLGITPASLLPAGGAERAPERADRC